MNFGVIGVRSKHLMFFRASLERLWPDGEQRITHVLGFDEPELEGSLAGLQWCRTAEELTEATDGVIIALREGYQHAALAKKVLEAGKPVFIDKPFTCDPRQAREIAELAVRLGVPCTGGSTLCFTKEVRELKRQHPQCDSYSISYMADPFSPFGGWYFYGSHLTDLCVSLFGRDWTDVTAQIRGKEVTAQVQYPGFTVEIRTTPQVQPPLVIAGKVWTLDDQNCYDAGMAHFVNAAQGKEEGVLWDLVASTELMEDILTAI